MSPECAANCTAYVTLERFSGHCDLVILEEIDSLFRELKVHCFLLSFSHEGIKKYLVQKLIMPHRQYWEEKLTQYVQIDLPVAQALLQDALQQNHRFGTTSAFQGVEWPCFLDVNSLSVEREKLSWPQFRAKLTPVEFAHIYLAALKRMDNALLYDLSSNMRQKKLGPRQQFLNSFGDQLREFTFLKSKIIRISTQGRKKVITTAIIVGTPQDEIMKIVYQLVLSSQKGLFYLDDFQELRRDLLPEEHPENPVNYPVFCSVYHFTQGPVLKRWLENCPDVFLTGEFVGGTCYKLLRQEEAPQENFDVFRNIICEFMLTEKELFIYAQKPDHLAQKEFMLVKALGAKVRFKEKHYLPVRKLYQASIARLPLARIIKPSPLKSVFLFRPDEQQGHARIKEKSKYYLQLEQNVWYFFREIKKGLQKPFIFVEYFISGEWLRLHVYNGDLTREINKLGPDNSIITSFPAAEQWKMFKITNQMGREAPFLKAMGLIPSVKKMAQNLGILRQP